MSILLEALRKSEKKQRSREVPTIHSEFPSSQTSGPSRLVPIVLLLTVTLVVSGWFVWQQYRAPEDQGQVSGDGNPVISSQAAESGSAEAVAAVDRAPTTSGSAGEEDPAGNGPSEVDEGVSFLQPAVVDESSQGPRSRTPMESYQPPVSATASPVNRDLVTTNEETAIEETGKRPPASSGAERTGRIPAYRSARDRATRGDSESSEPGDSGSAEPESRSREPEPISYWELPDTIRADVPVIKFSVLVYDRDPAGRFVLVNGERLGEGDSLQPGLVVKEIRRDGVIFNYRLYQFLVER